MFDAQLYEFYISAKQYNDHLCAGVLPKKSPESPPPHLQATTWLSTKLFCHGTCTQNTE
jgi:hypothetical protein